jgi:hypothetical protein
VPRDLADSISGKVGTGCILHLPIGSFDHTPSRESLIATPRTKASVAAAMRVFAARWDELAREIADLAGTDVTAAVRRRVEVLNGDGNPRHLPIHYRVQLLPESVLVYGETEYSRRMTWRAPVSDDAVPAINFAEWCRTTLLITGWPTKRQSLRGTGRYMREFEPTMTSVVVLRGDDTSLALQATPFGTTAGSVQAFEVTAATAGIKVVTYAQMQEGLASLRVSTKRQAPRYDALVWQDTRWRREELTLDELADIDGPILHTNGYQPSVPVGMTSGAVVSLGRKSAAKLEAEVGAVDYYVWVRDRAREIAARATRLDWEAAQLRRSGSEALFAFAAAALPQIADHHPAAVLLRRMSSIHTRATSAAHREIGEGLTQTITDAHFNPRTGNKHAVAARKTVETLRATFLSMYPLLDTVHCTGTQTASMTAHLITYLATVEPVVGAATPVTAAA